MEAAIKKAFMAKEEEPVLGPEDEKLAKAIDRINADADGDLIRGLLFIVAQKIPDARQMVLSAYVNVDIIVSCTSLANSIPATRC